MKPLVSIVTPYLNAADFFAEAITSVEKQSLSRWELLLIDDGSVDSSRKIADTAAARDKRIRSLARPAELLAGAASTRNWGLKQAVGDYFAFLDADDLFMPEKLEIEIDLMQRFPNAAITCGGTMWWYKGHEYRNWSDEIRSVRPGLYRPPYLLNYAFLLQRAHVPCLCGVMVRRDALPPEMPFEPSLALYEDQSFLVKILAERSVYIGRHLTAKYRRHPGSTSSRARNSGDYQEIGPHPARSKFLAWTRTHLETRSEFLSKSAEALLLAEAIQSGDYSKIDIRQRADLILWQARKFIANSPRRMWRRLKRHYLKVRLRSQHA